MTREQQISDAAQMSDLCGNLHDLDCFVAGAQWADSHPCWHKYPEDKPRYSDTYNVAFDNGMVLTMMYYADLDMFDGYYTSKIVAWMELPKPPKFN